MNNSERPAGTSWSALFILWLFAIIALTAGAPQYLRASAALLFVSILSYSLGQRLAPHANSVTSWITGLATICSYFVLIGTLLFYLDLLSQTALALLSLASPLLLVGSRPALSLRIRIRSSSDVLLAVLYAFYGILVVLTTALLIHGRTTESTVSPWPLVNQSIFPLFFALSLILIAISLRSRKASPLLLTPVFLLAFSVATLLFPLGFGYDPFIHDATISLLDATGTITPKPPYYVGYYILVLLIKTFSGFSISSINLWLTPITAGFLVPLSIYGMLRYAVTERRYAVMLPLAFLMFPYPDLIQSTPQSASFLWALVVIGLIFIRLAAPVVPWSVIMLSALTAAAFHPLTGLPLVCAASIAYVWCLKTKRLKRRIIITALFSASALCVPLLLVITGALSPEFAVHITLPNIQGVLEDVAGPLYRFITTDDLVYGFSNVSSIIMLALLAVGVVGSFRQQSIARNAPLLISGAAVFASYLIVRSMLQFDFATAGEQTVFADRLLSLSRYMFLPFILLGTHSLFRTTSTTTFRLAPTILVCMLATASWYLSYPRFDTHFHNKGYSAGAADYAAVRWIDADASGRPYVVLANQTVSAVAVKEFGFRRYYNGLFYYPLPTNGTLYTYFLKLTKEPTRAAQLLSDVSADTGVQRMYFVLNRYWESYSSLSQELMSAANASTEFGDGRVTVFRFDTN